MISHEAATKQVADWIEIERRDYAGGIKYAETSVNRTKAIEDMQANGLDGDWIIFISNYIRRAELLRVETPQGRQALAKAIVTLMHCLETAVQVYGNMPTPGVPSGEIAVWDTWAPF